MTALLLLVALAQPPAGGMEPVTPGAVEGRPGAAEVSPLQARIDAAAPGSTVDVPAGRYVGDLILDRPLRLVGHGRPLLVGSGAGSVVRVRADRVVIEGFDIDGRGGGDLGRDSAGIHVTGRDVTIRDCRIRNALFGVYLREADGATIEASSIHGIPGRDPGEKGSGIHAWNTQRFRFVGNEVVDARDGFYIQSSGGGFVAHNSARDLRYGLHYMYSDDNVFEDNVFTNAAAGTTLMYSRRIAFRRNQFVHNRGFASVGLLFKECDDIVAEDNLVADNARGIFLEGGYRNRFRGNIIAESDVALVLYDSTHDLRFEGNSFVANLSPLQLVGRRTDTVFAGNYWSDHEVRDLDGDGIADTPYRLSNVFDHLRGNLVAADLFAQGLAGRVLGAAEETFPVLDPVPVVDTRPLAHPPALPRVPRPAAPPRSTTASGLVLGAAFAATGTVVLLTGRRGLCRREARAARGL